MTRGPTVPVLGAAGELPGEERLVLPRTPRGRLSRIPAGGARWKPWREFLLFLFEKESEASSHTMESSYSSPRIL